MSEGLFDSGAQNERTRLAWQRTLLSGLACSVLVARLLAAVSVTLAIAIGLAAVLSTAVLSLVAVKRYAGNEVALRAHEPVSDARAHLLVTALVVLTALGSLTYVLLG